MNQCFELEGMIATLIPVLYWNPRVPHHALYCESPTREKQR